jgi:hypothetical protein
MSKASNGQQMLLSEALLLLDKNGEPIKFDKNDDGTYTGTLEEKGTTDQNGKKLPGNKYTYRIDVQPQIANVSVVEEVVEEKSGSANPKATAPEPETKTTSKSKKY